MFKRFLKFFRGEEDAPAEPYEGSYLDHLLAQVQPEVVAQLEENDDHDPLLLVVVAILRLTMKNEWSPKLRSPLLDSQSPGPRPPAPPPGLPDSADNVQTGEFDAIELDDDDPDLQTIDDSSVSEESADDSSDSSGEAEPPEGEESAESGESPAAEDEEAEDEEAEDEEDSDEGDDQTIEDESFDPPPVPRSTRKTEEIDVEEVRKASLQASLTDTAELDRFEAVDPEPTVEIDKDQIFSAQERADGRPRIDSEEVLQAGRVFLGLLIENDRLPIELQLSVAETTLARDLLLGYFVGNDDFEEKARRLLTLVEQKFGEGLFSQARILLQLFHTDEQTRINNDRNLFYEDMILRLGIRRRHRMSAEELKRFQSLLEDARSPDGARTVCNWLGDVCLIHLQGFNRDIAQIEEWNEVLEHSKREGGSDNFLRYVPPRRWRAVGTFEGLDVLEQVKQHIGLESAREYVISQIKSCYFVLRAVGDTGLEGYLDTFFDWAEGTFDLDGTRLMPELYKRSMMDPEPMTVILGEVYDKFFAEATEKLMAEVTDDQIETALYDALVGMGDCDLGEVAPGYYNLGAFVFDRLFGVEYPGREFPFKIHRLT